MIYCKNTSCRHNKLLNCTVEYQNIDKLIILRELKSCDYKKCNFIKKYGKVIKTDENLKNEMLKLENELVKLIKEKNNPGDLNILNYLNKKYGDVLE